MKPHRTLAGSALAMIVATVLALTTPGLAHAYVRSDYPGAVMSYQSHPAGFPDSTEVTRTGPRTYYPGVPGYYNALVCTVPLGTASAGGASARVRTQLVPLVTELMARTEALGYDIRSADTGGYNCRYIKRGGVERPDLGISNHAYGRAIDINWNTNPQQSTFKSDIPPAVVRMWINHGFYWGGHYGTTPDTMHFEYVGTFADIGTYYSRLTGQPAPTPPPVSCPSSTLSSYPQIQQGATGTAVTVLQCELRQRGYSLTVDGSFGPATDTAVRSFQRGVGLAADGVVGPRSWTALLAAGTQPTLRQGSTGADVTRLQQALRARGYSIAVDGSFGSGTNSVVVSYQSARGLVADGIVGAKTWTALQQGR